MRAAWMVTGALALVQSTPSDGGEAVSDPAISRAHFTPEEDEVILRMTDGRLLALDLGSRKFRTIAHTTGGYDAWISPSGRFGARETPPEVHDFKSGETRSLGDRYRMDIVGFTPDADDLLLYRKDPPRFVRESAATGGVQWELPDPEGPRQTPRVTWSSSRTMALVEAGGWCKLIDARNGRVLPLHPDFDCRGMSYAVFEDDDRGFVCARRNPHREILYPVYYDLRSHQFVDIESRVDPVGLSVAHDRIWTSSGVSLQERRLSTSFAVLHETEMACATRLRPKGTEWFLGGCDPTQLQSLRFPGGSMRPIGTLFERFGQGVLVASPSGKKVVHSVSGRLQVFSTADLDDPLPPFTIVALPDSGVTIER